MSSQQINYQSQYKCLKPQYDALLDKNQNDLIKIKQRQRQFTDQLDRLRQEKESQQHSHNKQMGELKEEIEKMHKNMPEGELTVKVNYKERDRIEQLQTDSRKLIDQNIMLTSENTSLTVDLQQLKRNNEDLTFEIERMKQFILSLQNQNRDLKERHTQTGLVTSSTQTEKKIISEDDMNLLKQNLSKIQKELQATITLNSELKQKMKALQQQTRTLSDRQRKSVNLLKKKEVQLIQVHEEVQKLRMAVRPKKRKTESEQSMCLRCREHEQEIQLLKQMVKSTKGMVRVRQIQVQKYRMHNNSQDNSLKDNKSYGKMTQKSPSLPPLKKNIAN